MLEIAGISPKTGRILAVHSMVRTPCQVKKLHNPNFYFHYLKYSMVVPVSDLKKAPCSGPGGLDWPEGCDRESQKKRFLTLSVWLEY
jgi:hypothetical protein